MQSRTAQRPDALNFFHQLRDTTQLATQGLVGEKELLNFF